MTPSQIQLVRSALPFIAAEKEQVACMFYSRLFQFDPALRDLFGGDMIVQGDKLTTILDAPIASLNRPDQIVPVLQTLGQRHADYGVRDSNYTTVGSPPCCGPLSAARPPILRPTCAMPGSPCSSSSRAP